MNEFLTLQKRIKDIKLCMLYIKIVFLFIIQAANFYNETGFQFFHRHLLFVAKIHGNSVFFYYFFFLYSL